MQIVDELKKCKTFSGSSKHTIEDFTRRTLSRPVLGDLPRSGRPKDKKASKRAKAERGRIKKVAVSEEDYWEPPLTMVQFAKAFDHARACGRSNDIVIRNGQFADYRRVRAAGTAELIKQTRTMPTAEKIMYSIVHTGTRRRRGNVKALKETLVCGTNEAKIKVIKNMLKNRTTLRNGEVLKNAFMTFRTRLTRVRLADNLGKTIQKVTRKMKTMQGKLPRKIAYNIIVKSLSKGGTQAKFVTNEIVQDLVQWGFVQGSEKGGCLNFEGANAERGITLSAKFGNETTHSELASTLVCSLDDAESLCCEYCKYICWWNCGITRLRGK